MLSSLGNQVLENMDITFKVKYRDTLTGDIFNGPEKMISTNIGTSNSCGSETL